MDKCLVIILVYRAEDEQKGSRGGRFTCQRSLVNIVLKEKKLVGKIVTLQRQGKMIK